MGIDEIKELITAVGFPICCCIVLFYNNSKFTETLNNLNVTLTNLVNRIENLEENIKNNSK